MTGTTTSPIPVHPVDLGPGVGAWFTGRPADADEPAVGAAGNLSHSRPHEPRRLADDRGAVCHRMGIDVEDLHHMRQVHGAAVGTVDATTVPGAEIRDVDALVTVEPGRALAVQVADCVPVLLASDDGPVGAIHAGRRGLHADVIEAALDRLASVGARTPSLRAVIGPAIGGCCYEVPEDLQREVGRTRPAAVARTTWGTPSLDLPRAAERALEDAGVAEVRRFGGCTRCDSQERWFSHRAAPDAGRQLGVVVRLAA